ncbi:hypothetical protein SARC_03068 [Sphaeroforma arctica JP610]|uniref:DEP domain-containing protein n=1 Tax=Sphaeroforma arctica JP610 TaxID=667725 RepID=A0A0L0G6S6_9EUKA|nr:hypothetical protein SARC_03068 [Sphaeroforma arctica JP610]KNC84727.1 hypothetical protein SARC_03068 [Sphaeroforma arctica JP610]|eukprot:XP_014158629.1 hypothetical protein SARC_03068 [Sphaeroforma arctica JP610]
MKRGDDSQTHQPSRKCILGSEMTQTTLKKDALADLISQLRFGVDVRDRTYHLKAYKQVFVGSDAVDFIEVTAGVGRAEALNLGKEMFKQGVFEHATGDHDLKDAYYFYRFKDDVAVHTLFGDHPYLQGEENVVSSPSPFTGHDYNEKYSDTLMETLDWLEVSPLDVHNNKLLSNVHPTQYKNPSPQPNYNMVVIGAGAAGLVTAIASAGVGAKVAIIEKHLMGGDCLNVGCVPSKALIRAARAIYEVKNSEQFGITCSDVKVDFGKIMERMRRLRAQISDVDSVQRFSKAGVDVYIGEGKFTSKNTVEVNGQTLKFSKACVATGGRAGVPAIPGIQDIKFLTNATLFNLTELPKRFGVIGTGAIGCEMAQSFRRFGSEVSLFGRSGHLLGAEEQDAIDAITNQFEKEGIKLYLSSDYERIEKREGAEKETEIVLHMKNGDKFVFDELLVAAGRVPNVENLNLDVAGVDFDKKTGVVVNDYLQTTNSNIYAAGDICFKYKFTHVADFLARIVVRNALFFGKSKASDLLIPWAIYTEPEVAHVGLYEKDAIAKHGSVDVYKQKMDEVDRAILEGETEGFVKVVTKKGSADVIGATVVAGHAGDMISELTVAMAGGVNLQALSTIIHPYPTQAEAIRKIGDQYNRTRLTPVAKKLLNGLLAIQR